MHLPDSQPRPSLYYHYQVFEPWLPSDHPPSPRKKVVIVGCGPAGMVTALELARHGVPSLILSAERQFSQGSRAICFTRRSLEILQQVGVAQRMTAIGLPWRFGNSFYRGQKVFRMEAPHSDDERFYPILNVQQQYMEEFLHDACQAHPLIEVRWGNKVEACTQQGDYATLRVDTPAGEYFQEADWVVDASGGRSALRTAMNLQMEGASYEGFFVIADIRIALPLPTERLAFFDPEWNPGNTVLMHREPFGIWRVDYQLPPGETPEQALNPASMAARINAQLASIGFGGLPWEVDWCSVYSARTLTLPDYVHDRLIFTGDSAHLLPIFGVRGANTGFQDAQSLGWHLAFVVKGLADPSLLANYSAERVGAAREIIAEGGKSTRFMTPPSHGFKLLRNAVLSLSLSQEFVRPLYHWRTSRPHEYRHSTLNCPGDDNALFATGPAHGAPPRNVRLGADDFLLDHLGASHAAGFELLYFTSGKTLPQDLQLAISDMRAQGVPLRVLAIGGETSIATVEGADATLLDGDGRIRQLWGVSTDGSAYLLRPDQHVCARWLALDGYRLRAALRQALPQVISEKFDEAVA